MGPTRRGGGDARGAARALGAQAKYANTSRPSHTARSGPAGAGQPDQRSKAQKYALRERLERRPSSLSSGNPQHVAEKVTDRHHADQPAGVNHGQVPAL